MVESESAVPKRAMAQHPVTTATRPRLHNAASRVTVILAIVVAVTACGGGAGAGGGAGGAVPKVCQDARKAFHDWIPAQIEAFKASDSVTNHSIGLNVKVEERASAVKIKGLLDEVNAAAKVTQQKLDKSAELYTAFQRQFDACLAAGFAKLPPACADEFGQHAAVTAAAAKITKAHLEKLTKVTAMRTALIKRDQRAVDTAVKQITVADDKLDATVNNWNKTVLPKYEAAVEACNKAIS